MNQQQVVESVQFSASGRSGKATFSDGTTLKARTNTAESLFVVVKKTKNRPNPAGIMSGNGVICG